MLKGYNNVMCANSTLAAIGEPAAIKQNKQFEQMFAVNGCISKNLETGWLALHQAVVTPDVAAKPSLVIDQA